eukprot:g16544.t1
MPMPLHIANRAGSVALQLSCRCLFAKRVFHVIRLGQKGLHIGVTAERCPDGIAEGVAGFSRQLACGE